VPTSLPPALQSLSRSKIQRELDIPPFWILFIPIAAFLIATIVLGHGRISAKSISDVLTIMDGTCGFIETLACADAGASL
jgi:hypothetical protein